MFQIKYSITKTMNPQWILLFALLIHNCSCKFPNIYRKIVQRVNENTDDPLILTPLILENQLDEAKSLSEVNSDIFLGVKSYSGYLTVDSDFNSNLFFWFFPSEHDFQNDPVLLWLQGGPGASSMFGLFEENGPFQFSEDGTLELREYSWHKNHSVIYIDNPVGTGFSFTDNGYAQNETKVGTDLHVALTQFFTLFSELQDNDFFVTGESYAGKYAPAVSWAIHTENPSAKLKINLQGIAIGNGLSDPEHQMVYGDYLYQIGLIDSNGRGVFKQYEEQINYNIVNENYNAAYQLVDEVLNGDGEGKSFFKNVSGYHNYYNYLYPVGDVTEDVYMDEFLQRSDVKSAIHVGKATFNDGGEVGENLSEDIMKSVAPWISILLSNYRMLIYNGQLDIIVAYSTTVNYLQHLNFTSAAEYVTASRNQWYVDDELAGYYKKAGNLTEVLVRNAGHMVPSEQPKWANDLISRFVKNKL